MADKDTFDFSQFMKDLGNVDDATRNDLLRDDLTDQMRTVMADLGPRLWSVIQSEMAKEPDNNIHQNAVMNASLFAILSWIVACSPEGPEVDAILRDKVMGNLERAIATGRDNGAEMARFALNIGRLQLMEDACSGLGTVLTQNSMIIRGIHSHIEKDRKGGS